MISLKKVSMLCLITLCSVSISADTVPEIPIQPPVMIKDYKVKATVEVHEKIDKKSQQKKIVIFFDGTGDTMQKRSNVIKLFEISANQNIDNIKYYYHKGVGSNGKIIGGATGLGLKNIVQDAYIFLSQNYTPDTKVYVFGFSRGAFTSRVFTNFIDTVGLYDLNNLSYENATDLFSVLYSSGYRGKDKTKQEIAKSSTKAYNDWKNILDIQQKQVPKLNHYGSVEVEILGLFDTVAAMGLKVRNKKENIINFYDTYFDQICNTKHVLQALSLDDNRAKVFTPVIISSDYFTSKCENSEKINISSVVNEVWFSGAHSDVGGGLEDKTSLSGVALNWMLDEVKKLNDSIIPNYANVFENKYGYSEKANTKGWKIKTLLGGTRTKIIDKYADFSVYKTLRVHQSVIDKIENPTLWQGYSSDWYKSDKFKECFKVTGTQYQFTQCNAIKVVK